MHFCIRSFFLTFLEKFETFFQQLVEFVVEIKKELIFVFSALEKQIKTDSVHSRTIKIVFT